MIITIDGPTASGKSSVARALAEKLCFKYLNSGFLFRSVAYICLRDNRAIESLERAKELVDNLEYIYGADTNIQVLYCNTDITDKLKTAQIDQAASCSARNPYVRQALLEYQRFWAQKNNCVTDGRDSGSVVFPQAEYKFFLTALPSIRAKRWQQDQKKQGFVYNSAQALILITERDERDMGRIIAPLIPADDAYIVDSSHMGLADVLGYMYSVVEKKAAGNCLPAAYK
jgi:cytidylate kinase